LSNKQCSQTRHSSTKLIPSSIIKTQYHNLDKHNAHKQDIHLPNIIPRSIIKTQSHNLDKQQCSQNKTFIYQKIIPSSIIKPNNATIWTSNNSSQSNKQERINLPSSKAHPNKLQSSSQQAPSSKTQYHKSNTTISFDTQRKNSKFQISDVVTKLKHPTPQLPTNPKTKKQKKSNLFL
jgi:hypothetical protein